MKFTAWIEIDLDGIKKNLSQLRAHSSAKISLVVKGDAYGHGAPPLVKFLQDEKVQYFAVSDLQEALAIRTLSQAPLLMLSPPLPEQIEDVIKYKITPTITSPEQVTFLAQKLTNKKKPYPVHLKVDTGLGRLGVLPKDALNIAQQIQKYPILRLEGVFTHFARGQSKKATEKQLREFNHLKQNFSDSGFTEITWHAANSASFLQMSVTHMDMVRIGTLLYGQSPLNLDKSWELSPTWSFHTRIIQVRQVPPGTSVGYGSTYTTTKTTTIGVIPTGFGHGLEVGPLSTPTTQMRQAVARYVNSHRRVVNLPDGSSAPLIGKVGMGLASVDLSSCSKPFVGMEVVVPMRHVTANSNLPKIYLENKQPKWLYTHDGKLQNIAYNKFFRISSHR